MDVLYEEVAFLGYYLHWSRDDIMSMEHKDRIRYCKEVSKINSKINEAANPKPNNPFDPDHLFS